MRNWLTDHYTTIPSCSRWRADSTKTLRSRWRHWVQKQYGPDYCIQNWKQYRQFTWSKCRHNIRKAIWVQVMATMFLKCYDPDDVNVSPLKYLSSIGQTLPCAAIVCCGAHLGHTVCFLCHILHSGAGTGSAAKLVCTFVYTTVFPAVLTIKL